MIDRAALPEPLPPRPTTITRTHAVHPQRPIPPEVSISAPVSCTSSRNETGQVHSSVTVTEEQDSGRGLRLWAEFFAGLQQTMPTQLPITASNEAPVQQVSSPSTCTWP